MWVWYFMNGRRFALWTRMPMAILPSVVFLLTGALCLNAALSLFAVIFAFAHCYNTYGAVRQLRAKERARAPKKGANTVKKKKKA